MQASVPELTDLASEPDTDARHVRRRTCGSPARSRNTALMARRLVERGVRFVQVYHHDWDHHGNLAGRMPDQCRTSISRAAALIQDLKRRGLLDNTLVIWGGEFGRTIYCQGGLTEDELRPRPPPALLHHVDGRRRHQGRHGLRRDRRLQLQHRRRTRSTSATSTRPSCTCSASTTSASPTAIQGLDQRLTGVEKANVIKEMVG